MKRPKDVDGRNGERASWALAAIRTFQKTTGTDDGDAICDFLCDLMHLSDRKAKQFGAFERGLERARMHYDAETGKAPY